VPYKGRTMRRYGENNRMGIEDKVAVVTGAASGIGRGAALVFAREGAKVVVTDGINLEGGRETVRLIREAGGEATFVTCDVTKESDVEAMVAKTVELYGSLDFAYNNAGIGPDAVRIPVEPIAESSTELWQKHLDVNLTGVYLCLKYEMRQMIKQEKGAIVNCSSAQAFRQIPGFAAYGSTKTGIVALTKVAALEGARSGIRVNCVCPGPIANTMLSDNITSIEGMRERMTEAVPLGRMGDPQDDMGEAVLWLCSDAASFITGAIVPVDGGLAI
jgi:NAD(P)-dependent dehydrogenase (short-subunit alcohol dehydrogenase family)